MRTVFRHSTAIVLSVIAHAIPVVWSEISFFGDMEIPQFEIELTEVELIDPDMIQGEEPKPVEQPPPPVLEPQPPMGPELPPEAPEDDGPKEDESKEDEEPERDLGERRSKVDRLGPESSTFFAMLVPRRIRELGFREQAMDIMVPLPDFDYLVAKGGFDPLRDFDHIVIASADIRDWRQTFLAVDHNLSRSELQAGIERAAAQKDERVEWVEENGIVRGNPQPLDTETPDVDTRWFVLLENDIAVYVLPQFLPYVLGEKEITEEKTTGNFVGNLAKLRRFAARQPTSGLQVVVKDFRSALARVRGIPFEIPDRIELSAEAESSPELLITLGFVTALDAKAFEQWWTDAVAKMLDDNFSLKLTVKPFYDLLEIDREGKQVRLWGEFTQGQTEQVLELISGLVAKGLHKTPEEIEAQRQQRIERWKARKGGKLPPSAALGDDASNEPADETPSPGPGPDGEEPARDDADAQAASDPV